MTPTAYRRLGCGDALDVRDRARWWPRCAGSPRSPRSRRSSRVTTSCHTHRWDNAEDQVRVCAHLQRRPPSQSCSQRLSHPCTCHAEDVVDEDVRSPRSQSIAATRWRPRDPVVATSVTSPRRIRPRSPRSSQAGRSQIADALLRPSRRRRSPLRPARRQSLTGPARRASLRPTACN